MLIVRRLLSAWNRHSPSTFFGLDVKYIFYFVGNLFRKTTDNPSGFDYAYGTETEKIREVGSLSIDSDNARHAVRYQPSPQTLASALIHALPIDHSQFTFLDFGAGKGRGLLVAAQLPFAAVTGIELSRELCAVSTDNIGKTASDKRIAGRIECHYDDVTRYPLPELPLVCNFYNPFDQIIMRKVKDRLVRSLKDKLREAYILYAHSEHRALFDGEAYWDVTEEGPLRHLSRPTRQSAVVLP